MSESRLHVIQVIGGLSPAEGGPSYSVPRLAAALSTDADVAILSVAGRGEPASDRVHDGYRDRRFNSGSAELPAVGRLRLSRALRVALASEAESAQVIHAHGLWQAPGLYAAAAAGRARKPLVISPRGMLSPVALSFSKTRKRVAWWLWQQRALRQAACLHATSEAEYRDIRRLGFTNPVALIPNGIDLPAEDRREAGSVRTVLSLGRLHPKKGLPQLLRAWARVEHAFPDWRLRIAGPAEIGHDVELKALTHRLGLARISIEGAIYVAEKLAAYRDADLFVLPSLDENFGITVAEALAAGTPVISTTGAPWAGLESEGCGWWVEQGEGPIASALTTAMALPPEQLRSMGAKGRRWMERDFTWQAVAAEMARVYQWLAHEEAAPPSVTSGR